jgi:hypothetical protein
MIQVYTCVLLLHFYCKQIERAHGDAEPNPTRLDPTVHSTNPTGLDIRFMGMVIQHVYVL